MKRLCTILALSFLPAGIVSAEPVKHRFLCIDNYPKHNQLIYVNQHNPAENWAAPLPGAPARDIQLVGKGRVLVSVPSGCQEHDLKTGEKLWGINTFRNVNTARRLADGTTLLGANAKEGITVYIVDRAGKELSRQALYPETGTLRVLRLTPEGNYLFTLGKPKRAVETTPEGRIVWSAELAPFGGKGYKVLKTAAGHYLASTGNGVKVVEFSPTSEVVRYWGEEKKGDHPDWRLDFFSGFDLLPNGNVVVANWLGHGKHGTGPHLVEFDAENRLVWQWEDHELAKQITNAMILDGREEAVLNGDAP